MTNGNCLLLILLTGIMFSCRQPDAYVVTGIDENRINIDGENDESEWTKADNITLINPWGEVCPKTTLSLLNDSRNLYFFFDVDDDEILLDPEYSNERDMEKEDRVEIYFSKDKKMDDYYCFEIDAKGNILAYKGSYYRNFDFEWNPPAGFKAFGQIRSGGYLVEGCVPLEFLRDFMHTNSIYCGAYRAEFKKQDNLTIENWQIWKDPATAEPDFHVPASLGMITIN